jgi:hypothetical protein
LTVPAPSLRPKDPLTQVVFVHDYVQLLFQDCRFSCFFWPTLRIGETVLSRGTAGYCDTLVSLIGQSVHSADADGACLSLRFGNGALMQVPSFDPDSDLPEAWMFTGEGRAVVVQQNTPD